MKIPLIHTLVFFTFTTLLGFNAYGQNNNNGASSQSGAGYFDLAVKTGSLLPYDIEGVRDLLPMWGMKIGHDVSKSLSFEYDIDMANAKGVTYYLAYWSLRHDFVVGDVLPVFFLLGLDAHYYKRRDSYGNITGQRTEYDFQFNSGWHMGVGTETLIYGNIWFRADFRLGISPGRQLVTALAGVYRF